MNNLIVALVALLACSACTRPHTDATGSGVLVERANGTLRYTNRLIREKSPYLQMHAHNPVDWYPWGPEAFDKARRENKPIFLSIGYSACHWCHVMEAESFSNPEIAQLMNRSFVSIKVDREERPDIDRVYLAYVTSVSGGGWPMSLFLTPDRQPFFGATYIPPDTRGRDEGFRSILQRLAGDWQTRRGAILQAAAAGASSVSAQAKIPGPSETTPTRVFDETYDSLSRSFDRHEGGFGGAPKFPRPVVLTFLMRYYHRTGRTGALDMTRSTLRAMSRGGIHDVLGGGFHRYTVDAAWRTPHFEKMLYDQAEVAQAYTEAFQLTRDAEFADTAQDVLAYVLRDMRDAAGGFYSAEDADSAVNSTDDRLAEGAFYVWTLGEIQQVLGRDAPLVAYHFDLSPDEARTLAARHSVRETAARFGMTDRATEGTLDSAVRRLREARAARPRPARDEKILTAWNGLMISALARAGQVFDRREYVDAGAAAAGFVESRLFDASSTSLKRRYHQGAAEIDGLLEDYALFIQGLLDLYEASFEPHWLALASRLQATEDRLFWDDKDGAYFSTRADAPDLIARMKEDYDGAEPAANSVSAMNLLRLWQFTESDAWRARADATFRALSGRVARSGSAVPQLVAALDFWQSTPKQIVIAGDSTAADTHALLRLVHDRFMPDKVLALVDGGRAEDQLARLVPFVAEKTRRNGRATIYICKNYACRLPTSDLTVAARLLDEP